jgi:hypothetical protein
LSIILRSIEGNEKSTWKDEGQRAESTKQHRPREEEMSVDVNGVVQVSGKSPDRRRGPCPENAEEEEQEEA